MLQTKFSLNLLAIACVVSACMSGCTAARTQNASYATAPGLKDDALLSKRGGTNPNAPYTVVDHSARLVKRPTLLDVNAAAPCAASDLNLFESGAQVDGARRSVRLNLVNHAKEPCRLSGYPAISLLRPDGSLIGDIAIEKVTATTLEAALRPKADTASADAAATASPYVLLAPAGEATFEVGWTSGPECSQVGSIAVAAPGSLQSFLVRHTLNVCQGRILVTAISDGEQL